MRGGILVSLAHSISGFYLCVIGSAPTQKMGVLPGDYPLLYVYAS
jgi:hypothetical protein